VQYHDMTEKWPFFGIEKWLFVSLEHDSATKIKVDKIFQNIQHF
jgi:hypothetical protein